MLFGSFKNSLKLTLLIRTSNIKIQNGFDRASSSLPSASAVGNASCFMKILTFHLFTKYFRKIKTKTNIRRNDEKSEGRSDKINCCASEF